MKQPFELVAEIEEKDAEIKRLKDEEAKVVKELQALARLVDSLIAEKAAEIDAMAKLAVLLKADIAEKDAEIERLESKLKLLIRLNFDATRRSSELSVLCIRAAEALGPYEWGFPDGNSIRQLIAELRKAAE